VGKNRSTAACTTFCCMSAIMLLYVASLTTLCCPHARCARRSVIWRLLVGYPTGTRFKLLVGPRAAKRGRDSSWPHKQRASAAHVCRQLCTSRPHKQAPDRASQSIVYRGPRQPTVAVRMRLESDARPHQIKDQIGRCLAPPDQGSNRPMPGPTRSRIKLADAWPHQIKDQI
jgi:hypothetical protein